MQRPNILENTVPAKSHRKSCETGAHLPHSFTNTQSGAQLWSTTFASGTVAGRFFNWQRSPSQYSNDTQPFDLSILPSPFEPIARAAAGAALGASWRKNISYKANPPNITAAVTSAATTSRLKPKSYRLPFKSTYIPSPQIVETKSRRELAPAPINCF